MELLCYISHSTRFENLSRCLEARETLVAIGSQDIVGGASRTPPFKPKWERSAEAQCLVARSSKEIETENFSNEPFLRLRL